MWLKVMYGIWFDWFPVIDRMIQGQCIWIRKQLCSVCPRSMSAWKCCPAQGRIEIQKLNNVCHLGMCSLNISLKGFPDIQLQWLLPLLISCIVTNVGQLRFEGQQLKAADCCCCLSRRSKIHFSSSLSSSCPVGQLNNWRGALGARCGRQIQHFGPKIEHEKNKSVTRKCKKPKQNMGWYGGGHINPFHPHGDNF